MNRLVTDNTKLLLFAAASITLLTLAFEDAYAEVPITSCGTLDIPGETYILTEDLISSGTCLKITVKGITLDGNGHSITGSDSLWGVEVRQYATGATVKNLNISGFSTGIYVTSSDTHVIGNTLTNMSWSGITVSNSCGVTVTENTVHSTVAGIEAKYSTGIKIDKNNVDGNSQNGISVNHVDGVIITGNSAITPGSRGILVQYSNDGFLVDNVSSGNEAITLVHSHNNTLINNTIESCSDCNRIYGIGVAGIMIWHSNGNSLITNNVESTHLWGIHLFNASENTISGNLISGHHKEIASNAYGLLINSNSHNNIFKYNTISDNERSYNIQESTGNKIYNNNFISNLNEGRVIVFVEQEGSQYLMAIEDTSGSNVFYDSAVGGNYWDNFDDSSEGCEDLNNDNYCDEVYVSHGTLDNFAWSVPDGWLVNSPIIPDVDSLNIPEAAYCPGSEPEIPTCTEPEVLDAETNMCVTPEPEIPTCTEPEVLDAETNMCVTPEPEIPTCTEPEVLDAETNMCVTPEPAPEPVPETPTCVEPQVLDAETNMCVTPEPAPEPVPEIPPIEVGLMCHIPPGNPENPQTIMISTNAFPAHLAHGDYEGACTESTLEIQEFTVTTDNEALNEALEILKNLRENLDSDSNAGESISKAAKLHQLFAHEDKTTKKLFQTAFTQFNHDVKAYYGDTQEVSGKSILNDLDKAALKIKMQISKAEKDEQVKNKIQSAVQFVNTQKELNKIKNQIGLEKLKFENDNETLEDLKLKELHLLKKTLLFTAKMDGKKVSPELFKSIKKQANVEVEENHQKNDGNNNSNDDSKSNNGKGNSGKGSDKSSKGNSGNNGNGNSGKGNSVNNGNSGKGKGK
jgi:parallel beta-helix repeat protein